MHDMSTPPLLPSPPASRQTLVQRSYNATVVPFPGGQQQLPQSDDTVRGQSSNRLRRILGYDIDDDDDIDGGGVDGDTSKREDDDVDSGGGYEGGDADSEVERADTVATAGTSSSARANGNAIDYAKSNANALSSRGRKSTGAPSAAAVWDAGGETRNDPSSSINSTRNASGVGRRDSYRTAAAAAVSRARGMFSRSVLGGSGGVGGGDEEGEGMVPLCVEMRIRHIERGAMSMLLDQTANVRPSF